MVRAARSNPSLEVGLNLPSCRRLEKRIIGIDLKKMLPMAERAFDSNVCVVHCVFLMAWGLWLHVVSPVMKEPLQAEGQGSEWFPPPWIDPSALTLYP